MTFIDLEFDTGTKGAALLGDIAASLVSIDELLRDLASIAAYPSSVEFRNIEIVAIEVRNSLKVRLALAGISQDAIAAFQDICRNLIAHRPTDITAVLERFSLDDSRAVTAVETQRLMGHVATLQHAAIPLKRLEMTAR